MIPLNIYNSPPLNIQYINHHKNKIYTIFKFKMTYHISLFNPHLQDLTNSKNKTPEPIIHILLNLGFKKIFIAFFIQKCPLIKPPMKMIYFHSLGWGIIKGNTVYNFLYTINLYASFKNFIYINYNIILHLNIIISSI